MGTDSKNNQSMELIPTLDLSIVADFLRTQGALSYLCIDASSFKQIEIEYGRPIYLKVKNILVSYLSNEDSILLIWVSYEPIPFVKKFYAWTNIYNISST